MFLKNRTTKLILIMYQKIIGFVKGKISKVIFILFFIMPIILFCQNNNENQLDKDKNLETNSTDIIRKEMPFEKYHFERTQFNSEDQELLMGSGEMGGWVSNNGLGFEKLWFADVWKNNIERKSLPGPKLILVNNGINSNNASDYTSELNIKNGILSTSFSNGENIKYSSKIFFSKTNKRVLVIHVKNESQEEALKFNLSLPIDDYKVKETDSFSLSAKSVDTTHFTQTAWNLRSNQPISQSKNLYGITIAPKEDITIQYSLVTAFNSKEYFIESQENTKGTEGIQELVKTQKKAWVEHWKRIGSIILPDGENAKWFYRSLYTLYATSGSEKFLPGELQFSIPDSDWKMHPFTYGYAGWAVWCYTVLGDELSAKKMAKWHYKPKALKENVKILFPKTDSVEVIYKNKSKGYHTYLDSYNSDAIAFGHELTTEGYNITYPTGNWDLQRQLDAFAASFFNTLSQYYPNEKFTKEYTYPVMKGTAELWSSLVKWDDAKKHYFLPPLLSVSENIMEKSVLDAVLAARWNLKMAAKYASELGIDKSLQTKWLHIYEHLYVPQNSNVYLEYLDDDQSRRGGGYFGIRAFTYFGFPAMETISDINAEKARRSLDMSWGRNDQGNGMITFIMNWFSLTESYLGYGNKAYEKSNLSTTIKDKTGAALFEYGERQLDGSIKGTNPYFLTGYSSFILSQIAMLMQSYNGTIKIFPAIPDHWKNMAFYDLPAQGGVKVSAILKSGTIQQIEVKNGNKIIKNNSKEIPTIIKITD